MLDGYDLVGRWVGRRRSVSERPAAELLATVRRQPAGQVGAARHDLSRIDVGLHDVVVPLDVVEVGRVAEAWRLEEVTGIRPEHGHLAELAAIALEMAVVDGV